MRNGRSSTELSALAEVPQIVSLGHHHDVDCVERRLLSSVVEHRSRKPGVESSILSVA